MVDGGRPGRGSHHDRASLVAVAVDVFARRGYDGTSMQQLADAAGITKSSFYHHVRGKEELLAAALDRALDALFAVLADAEAAAGTPLVRLERLVRGTVGVLAAELPYVRLLLRVRGNTVTERRALERRREFDRRVTALVAAAQGADELPPADPALLTRLLFGMINSISEWYRPGGPRTPAELADAVVGLALDGLRPGSGHGASSSTAMP